MPMSEFDVPPSAVDKVSVASFLDTRTILQ